MKRLYKVLDKDLSSPYQGFQFEIGRNYHCSNFDPAPDVRCSRGFYAVPIDGVPYAWRPNRILCECTVWGQEVIMDQYKQRYEYIRIGKRLTKREIVILAKAEEGRIGYRLSEVLYPVNPLILKQKPVGDMERKLLKEWQSVEHALWQPVGESVRQSVGRSVWQSVGQPVGESVAQSVGAYISSLFPNIQNWYGIDHAPGVNPFQPCIDLWRSGFVPSFDGTTWRLHQGKDAKIVYEMKK